MPSGGDGAGDERADGGGGERRPAAAGLGHLVAFERGRHRGALARRVDQDRGGRAAIHAAVVDAGEHDQRAGRIELEGDRQQQRDGQRRADAGQHADRGAEQHADQREQQVHRLQRDGEAVAAGRRARPWAGLRTAVRAARPAATGSAAWRTADRRRWPSTSPMARSMRMARRPNAVAVAANRIGGRRDEAAAEPDDGDQRGEAAEDQHDRPSGRALRARGNRRASASIRIADGEQRRGRSRRRYGIAFGPTP